MLSIRRSVPLSPAAALALLLWTGSLAAEPGYAADRPAAGAKKADLRLADPPATQGLKYRAVGPAWGGRTTRVAGVPGDPNVFYLAAASGGVWKSNDGGRSFSPIFDDQPISSIGSLAIAPSDPNVIYVGSGEANIRGNVAAGNGIYRSIDAGKTWSHVWKQEGQIGEMTVDPRNPNVAFAAVLGHAFGPNLERGVYRTTDGGKSWVQVLKKDADTGASSVALDPSNPNVVWAGLWKARRYPWDLASGGPGGGLWQSRDGGDSWRQVSGHGLPDGLWGKVGVAVAPSDPRRVFALIENEQGGLFRSDDGGDSWELVSADRQLRQRAWYYTTLAIHPTNPNEVWCPNVPMLKSIDGGKTFERQKGMHHGDFHDLWFDPKNPKRMIAGNDGGVDVSFDGGETWYAPPLPLGQFYHVSTDRRTPFHVAGAMQDIGTAQAPSDTLALTGIRNLDWIGVGGGEAGFVASDPDDPDVVYAGEYGGTITRFDRRIGQSRNVTIYPDNPSGHGAEDLLYRFQWTAPIHVSPHDSKTVYHAGNVLFRTRDGGQSWTAISPDLTRNDKTKQKWAGGPITGDNTGVEIYGTIFAVAESPVEAGTIWAGSDDGLVHVTRDGGAHWENVTYAVPGLPEWGTVSMIEPSPTAAGTAYLVIDAHRLDDMTPYLWKTTDYGKSWKRLGLEGEKALPRDVYLHAVRTDPARPGVLYLGTERGVALSLDDGLTWSSLKLNLPTVAVHDLAVAGDSLVVGTHGRSLWILDDLDLALAAAALDEKARAADFALLPSPDALRWTLRWDLDDGGVWKAPNPPRGVRLAYWLGKEPKGDVTLEVFTDAGRRVASRSSVPEKVSGSSEYVPEETKDLEESAIPKAKGLNVYRWDLAWDGAEMIPGGILDAGYPRVGPAALPGAYTFKLTVDGTSQSVNANLLPDPRFASNGVSPADLAEQLRLALEVRDDITRLTRTVERLRSIRKQIEARADLIRKDETRAELVRASEAAVAQLDSLEGKLHNPKATVVYDVLAFRGGAQLYSRMSPLYDTIKWGDGPPTQGMREEYAREKADLDRYVAELEGLIAGDLAALDRQAQAAGLPGVWTGGL